jgi:hypothetical protein
MSIIVSLTVPDAVILGVDSAAVLPGLFKNQEVDLPSPLMEWARAPYMKAYADADKLFALGERPVGVATYGTPMIADRWLGSHLHEFVSKDPDGILSRDTTVEEIAGAVNALFADLYERVTKPFLEDFRKMPFDQIPVNERPGTGFVIAGYSAHCYYPEVWHVFVPTQIKPVLVRKQRELSPNWFGISEPLERYYKGYSQSVLDSLFAKFETLHGEALSDEQKAGIYSTLLKHEYPTTASLMPASVGREYVRFLLELVTSHYQFAVGIAPVSAPIKIGQATYSSRKFEIFKSHSENNS